MLRVYLDGVAAGIEEYGVASVGAYAGCFIEAARVHVLFTREHREHGRQLAHQPFADGREIVVGKAKHTLIELEIIQRSLERDAPQLAKEGITLSSHGLSVRDNAVVVTLSPESRSDANQRLRRRYSGVPILIRHKRFRAVKAGRRDTLTVKGLIRELRGSGGIDPGPRSGSRWPS